VLRIKRKYPIRIVTVMTHPGNQSRDTGYRMEFGFCLKRPALIEKALFEDAGVIGNPIQHGEQEQGNQKTGDQRWVSKKK
jgi:hypothetical protein